jgi:acyl-CoA thioesterase FadM
VRAEVDYIQPLIESERIDIVGEIEKVGKTSITILQEMFKLPDRELVCKARFVAVFVDRRSGDSTPVPESFKQAFL